MKTSGVIIGHRMKSGDFIKRFLHLKVFIFILISAPGIVLSQTKVKYETFEIKMSQGSWNMGSGSPQTLVNGSNSYVLQMGYPFAGFNYVCPSTHLNGNSNTDSYYFSTSATTPYNPYLNGNTGGMVVWFIQMKSGQVGIQPGGFATNRQGMGVVLASSVMVSSNNSGDRYAVVYGDAADASATNGKLQLITVADGSYYTNRNVICGTSGPLNALIGGNPDDHIAVKITYNPSTNEWSLYARNDSSSFKGPLDPAPYTQIGSTTVNSTYTAASLNYNAFISNSAYASDRFYFDSYYVFTGIASTVGVPSLSVTSFSQSLSGNANMAGKSGCNTTDRTQFYELFGTNLTSNIIITPPAGIEVSTNDISGFTSSPLTITQTGGNALAKIYVRVSGSVAGSGNISNASNGATTKYIDVVEAPLGNLAANNVTVQCNNPSIPIQILYAATGTTLTGRYDPFNDGRAYTVTSGMANNTLTCGFQSGINGMRNFSAQEFQVSATGSYTFTMRTNAAYDGAGYITSGSFVPGTCPGTGTWISGADGAGGAEPVIGPVTLTAGISYTLITTTGGAPSVQGCYTLPHTFIWDITAPAGEQILLPMVTCDNTIVGNWSAYHTGSAATQVDNYSTRNTGMNNSSTCSFSSGTNHNYSTQDFTVDATGVYTFTMKTNSGYDGQGYIVSHTPQLNNAGFTFGSCTGGGTFIQGDDANGEATISNVQLTAGVKYTLVSSAKGSEAANNGSLSAAFSWTVTGAGHILIPGSGLIHWYTTPSGGNPLAYGGTFDPVGLDPLLQNTATAGIWTYYGAFSTSPNCRIPVNYTISCGPCTPTISTINPLACNTYISPSGHYTWVGTGTYRDTIVNQAGCDSLITINLTINTSPNAGTDRTISLCVNGVQVSLFDSIGGAPGTGGIWSGPSVLTGGSSGIFTPGINTSGVYSYRLSGSPPCANDTSQVTVNIILPANASINPIAPLCGNGSPVTLTAVTPGGLWAGSGITNQNAGTFSPANAGVGTHMIIYSLLNFGCPTTDTIYITVNPLPATPAAINGPVTICQGTTTSGYSTSASNAISFSWSILPSGAGSISGTGPSSSVTWNGGYSGNVTIGVVANNSCGSSTTTTTVVNVGGLPGTPSAIHGPNTLCQGTTSSAYTTSATNATSYQWTLSPTAAGIITGTGSTGTVFWGPMFSGTATISVTAGNACDTTVAITLQVTVLPAPTVSSSPLGNLTICPGDISTSYLTGSANALGFVWSITPSGAGSIANFGDSINVTWTPGYFGSADICVSAYNNCDTTTLQCTQVDIVPGAAANFTFITLNTDVTFTNTSQNSTSFQWAFGDNTTSTLDDPIHTYASAGNYIVQLIAFNQCGSDTLYDTITVTTVGIADFPEADIFSIYPNPFNNSTHLLFAIPVDNNVTIELFDVTGRRIHVLRDRTHLRKGECSIQITEEMVGGSAGVFIISISSGDTKVIRKLIHL